MLFATGGPLRRISAPTARALGGHRLFSLEPPASTELSSKSVKFTLTKTPKPLVPLKELVFGRTFSDHMLTVDWSAPKGWGRPHIQPYGKIALEPSAVVFHYGTECFEGMKAYKDKAGKIRLFRPDLNMSRFYKSAKRLALPTFDKKELLETIKEFIKIEERWIPNERGYSLYIRPTMIATQESLGVGVSSRAMFFCITSPVGPYYRTGFAAVSLLATTEYVRAWPGGTGDNKVGGNYAPCILPQMEAAAQGCQQNLWLFGEDHQVTEVGTMNCFVFWINEKGEKELITPRLDGTILPGVTRLCVLELAREWNEFKVKEGTITMSQVVKAAEEGRLLEIFGAGTACIVAPVRKIKYDEREIDVPLDPNDPNAQAGPLAKKFADTIMGIQYGEIKSDWSVVVD